MPSGMPNSNPRLPRVRTAIDGQIILPDAAGAIAGTVLIIIGLAMIAADICAIGLAPMLQLAALSAAGFAGALYGAHLTREAHHSITALDPEPDIELIPLDAEIFQPAAS